MERTKVLKKELTDEEIDKIMEEEFDKKFPDFESFKKDLEEKIEQAEREIAEGKGIPMEIVFAELEDEFHFNERV